MRNWFTKLLLRLGLINSNVVLLDYLSQFKIHYLHVVSEDNISDAFIGGSKTCSPDDLAAFILYNFSVRNSEDLIASIHGDEESNIDGEKLLEAYIRMSQDKLQELMLGLNVNQETPVDNSEEPIINPLNAYNHAKVVK